MSWNPRSRTMVMPARRDFSMLPAALKALIGFGSSIDCRARSWMPSQFRCAWLLIMPGMIVPPVSVTRPFGMSARGPMATMVPPCICTKPSSIMSPTMGTIRPARIVSSGAVSNIGLVIFW